MRVKRYVVDSMPDAMSKIRSDLGKDAIILNTKEIRHGGFLGMFSKKKIEVIAAIDPAAATKAATANSQISKRVEAPIITQIKSIPNIAILDRDDQDEEDIAFTASAPAAREAEANNASASNRDDLLLGEIKQMKEYMARLSSSQSLSSTWPPALRRLEKRLTHQEVEPYLVSQFLQKAISDAEESGVTLTEDSALESVRMQLRQLLAMSRSIDMETRIAHFVGPTGVGKTTTIAKLAAEQVLKYRRKVGFITADTYRIAAIEQLKTYANILNVPIEIVFSPQDVSKAFENLQGCDLIFMDTAGRNFRNEMYVSELNALLKSQGQSETFLVLSLTTKYRDMKAITNNFAQFNLQKVLFTKMDETDTYGAIVNVMSDFSLQLSYVTNGQNVPDDISAFNEEQIVDLILGDLSDE